MTRCVRTGGTSTPKPARELIGADLDGQTGVVVTPDVGREHARLPFPGKPHPGAGISWNRNGHRVVAIPHLDEGRISIRDMEGRSLVETIETSGPGVFPWRHDDTPASRAGSGQRPCFVLA